MITFSNPEFYFENEKQLNEIFEKLQKPEVRKAWIEAQAEEIFRKLPPSTFKFADYISSLPYREFKEEDFYKESQELPEKDTQIKQKHKLSVTALF
jgi:hypothetical protein